MAPLEKRWEGLCGLFVCVCVRWLPTLLGLCNMVPSSSIKKQLLALHMGAAKLVGSNLNLGNKKFRIPNLIKVCR